MSFCNVLDLVNRLEMNNQNKEHKLTAQLVKQDLVIVDELGYLPFSKKRRRTAVSSDQLVE